MEQLKAQKTISKVTTEEDPPRSEYPPLSAIVNVDDFEVVAKKYLSPTGWAYYASAADDEYSKQENHRIFRKIKPRPRVLRNVEIVDTTTEILGQKCALPIYVSPAGLGKYAHPEAECALARGAGKEGLVQCVTTSPSMPLETIYSACLSKEQPMFQQVYVNRDREKATAFVRRAVRLGATALFITVDSPVLGKREQDDRLKGEASPLRPLHILADHIILISL
jgi:L-lactate dehydrogenase (cytochrome)